MVIIEDDEEIDVEYRQSLKGDDLAKIKVIKLFYLYGTQSFSVFCSIRWILKYRQDRQCCGFSTHAAAAACVDF